MSKKHQPQKGETAKPRIQHVQEQNEPYLRSLQKRVRNLNKKLTEIADLESKDNLKPQQIEKINRKKDIKEQISKIEEQSNAFKEVLAQNAVHYRAIQLKELDTLARAIALYHSGTENAEQAKLGALWRVLENSDKNYVTLNEAVNGIGSALKNFANDRKLQKALNSCAEANGEKEFKNVAVNQDKLVNKLVDNIVPPVPEVKPEPVAKPAPVKVEAKPAKYEAKPVPAKVEEKKPEPEVVAEKVEKEPEVIVEQVPTPIQEEVKKVEGDKPAQEKRGDRPPRRDNNRERPYKPKDGDAKPRAPRRERPEGERVEGDRERKQYKPKYQEKKVEGEERERGASSSSSSSEGRQFKKDEIRKLQDEGFTVVGKPKPKAKDPKERRDFHDHQHGKKHHHHGNATNY